MVNIILQILKMSYAASWLILVVIFLRLVLKRAPKNIRCILWVLVGIRLICPFSFESAFSLVPQVKIPEAVSNHVIQEIMRTDGFVHAKKDITATQAPLESLTGNLETKWLMQENGTLEIDQTLQMEQSLQKNETPQVNQSLQKNETSQVNQSLRENENSQVNQSLLETETLQVPQGMQVAEAMQTDSFSQADQLAQTDSYLSTQNVMRLVFAVWGLGVLTLLSYAAISTLRLFSRVREGVCLRGNVWLCDRLDSPFILGVIRPRIFLPSAIEGQQMFYVLAHERAHLQRHDHWWKPLGYLVLCVHWFNPLVWYNGLSEVDKISASVLPRDLEKLLAEPVLREILENGENERE